MAAADDQLHDLGIVYFKRVDFAGQTYIDKRGITVPAEELTAVYAPMAGAEAIGTATHFAGLPGAHSYWLRVQATGSIVVRLLCQYGNDAVVGFGLDLAGLAPTNWGAPLQLVNQNNGTTANEFTLTSGLYLLQTASAHTTGKLRWEARAIGAAGEDFVRIAGRAV